jgi:hypothetical protein
MAYALVSGGTVVNVTVVELDDPEADGWIEIPDGLPVVPGWTYADDTFTAPIPSQDQIDARNAPLVKQQVNARLERRAKALAADGDRIGALELRIQKET